MALEKVINITANDNFDKTAKSADKLAVSLDKVDKESASLTKTSQEAGQSILDNGGVIGILNELTGGYASTVKDAFESLELFDKGTKINTLSQTIYTAVVGTSTGALKAFKIALATTGVGIIIIALGVFASKMIAASDATEEEVKQQGFLKIAIDATIDSYKNIIKEQDQYATAVFVAAVTLLQNFDSKSKEIFFA